MERFLAQQHIERYRRLLEIVSDTVQRRQIQNLLSEEEDKARELHLVGSGRSLHKAA
jgi:hypothetical protein